MKKRPAPAYNPDQRKLAWDAVKSVDVEDSVIVHLAIHYNSKSNPDFTILSGVLNMVHLRRSVRLVHVIYDVDASAFAEGFITMDPSKKTYGCTLYFEKMPLHQPLFTLLLQFNHYKRISVHNIKRTESGVHYVDANLDLS